MTKNQCAVKRVREREREREDIWKKGKLWKKEKRGERAQEINEVEKKSWRGRRIGMNTRGRQSPKEVNLEKVMRNKESEMEVRKRRSGSEILVKGEVHPA